MEGELELKFLIIKNIYGSGKAPKTINERSYNKRFVVVVNN